MNNPAVSDPRAEIDSIDSELLRLVNQRAAIALRVGAAKKGGDASLCDPSREREVINRLCGENSGPFDDQSVANIFQRIIDESLHLQQRTFHGPVDENPRTDEQIVLPEGTHRVAFLGEPGTFSEEAALGILGEKCVTISRPTFEELFASIEMGEADYIVAPLENSLVGSIHRCYDL